ncbi:tenascin-N isoform X4 [Cyprinodon tularosa]|uniref:tenascin-N isoform X4 n=1 Tax=Cyprinodon tularosa TaxID=77115 RepID=UPI0018E1DCE0|nr:tenascin-N isoform X4 [Cyprinodon tularosa]
MSVGLIWRALCLLSILCTLSRHVHCTENQPDLSGTERGLTFSHVYKIDIPGSSSCTVERLPVQETGLQQDTTSNGENDIIFKHNIRLQTSKCNCEESESFKELLYRVNGLEEEVNYLKTQCTQGCCGRGGAPGVDTSCSDHGTYQHDTCSCLCNPGWEGPDCSVSSCPDECSDNGRCVDGRCVCYEGYTGEDCSQLTCPGDCNDKGQCVDGKCVCFPHFTGEDCSIPKCPNDCEGNGQCVDGQCVCDDGFYGEDCSTVLAPKGLQLIQKTDVSLLVEWETVQGAEYYMLTYHPKFDEGAVEEVQIPNSENSYLITDLTPGVTYIVKVYAVIKKIQSEADMIKATTDVSTIDDMRVTGQTEVSIQVDWKNPQAEVDYFRLTHTDPSGQEEELNVQRSQEARTKHTIVGLYPGTEYQISVQSIKGNAEGKASFTTGVTDIDAPSNLVTTEVTEDTATVSWDKVQAEIEGYMLSYTSAEGSSSEIFVGRDSTSYRLVGLRPGVLHTVYIWAFRGDKVSEKSSTEAETELDAPTNLSVEDETDSSFRVYWDPTQAQIDGYMLTYSSSDGSREETPVGSDSSYVLTGLRPGVVYTVYLWAVRGSKASRKISTEAETEMDAPANLIASDITESSFSLSWDPVQAEIDGYILTYTSPDGSSKEIVVGPDSSTYILTGLQPAGLYIVYIKAMKRDKTSRSTSTQAETEMDAPANLKTRDITESSFSLSWDPVQAEIDGYILTYTSPDGSSKEIPVGPDSSTYILTGLRPAVLYTVYIQAMRREKTSRTISTQAETEMDAPANLIASDITESSFSLTWDPVQAEIDGYILTYTSPDGSSKEIPVGPESSTYMLTGLRPAVLYTVYIQAMRGDKTSSTISTQAETDMDAPANLIASDITESSFSLSWDPVQAEIDGYILTYTSPDGSSKEIPVGSDSSTYILTGLRPAVLYTVYIQATRGDKTSKKISTQAETDLDAPANLLAQDETESGFTVLWEPVQADIDGYMLTYSSAEGPTQEIPIGSTETSYSLKSLKPGVLYTVYVWAIKGNKVTQRISTVAETEIDSPKDLKATDVTIDSALLTWAPPLADIEGYILTYREEEGNLQAIERRLDASETSFTASNLKMGKRYIVTIVAFRGSKRSRMVETLFKTVAMLYPFPMDCVQIMRNGNNNNGIYTVYINNNQSKPIEVFCDMTTDGGGWLVLQRRNTGKLDFMKRWRQYIAGFGNMTEEFWLGLDKIYALTNTPTQYELRFDLGLGSERAYAVYDNFKIAPIRQKFKLTIGKYRGTAGDAMTYHQDRLWTTIDSDNDIALTNCARTHSGAWWYANCHLANLNGKWGDNRHSLGVNWEPWKGHLTSLDFTEMKIRPVGALSSRKKRSLMVREKKSRVSNTHK